jgi:transposase
LAPRDSRAFLAPDDDEEKVVVGQRKLAKLLRETEELRRENSELRGELERLRPTLAKAQKKNEKLADKAEQLQGKLETIQSSLAVLGADGKTAPAVGVPSSRTFYKPPRPPPEERRRPGGQPGHPGTTRPKPVPNAPEKVLALEVCPTCDTRLGDACDEGRHTLTDLPVWLLEIYDLVVKRYKCLGCGQRVHAPIPEGYRGDFGPRLKALVAQLRALGLSFGQIVEFLVATSRLELSEGTLHTMGEGVAQSLEGTYRELWEELHDARQTPNTEGDETGMSVNGETEQVWVGVSPTVTLYFTQHGSQVEKGARSADAAARMWAGYTGTLTHDGLASYHGVDAAVVHQLWLVHLNGSPA